MRLESLNKKAFETYFPDFHNEYNLICSSIIEGEKSISNNKKNYFEHKHEINYIF